MKMKMKMKKITTVFELVVNEKQVTREKITFLVPVIMGHDTIDKIIFRKLVAWKEVVATALVEGFYESTIESD